MKRAGIVTFSDSPNYGAVLQAYGLKYALERLGCSVVFLKNTGNQNRTVPEKDRQHRVLEALRRRRAAIQPHSKTFTKFSEKYFQTETLNYQNDVSAGYDFFIAGSDQVWNPEITGLDPFWFLDFAPPEKRFSYAASFGTDRPPEKYLSWYGEMLSAFKALSVRETEGQKLIRNLTGKEAAVCPDPVLLPERSVWEKLMIPAEKTVLLYMTEFDADLFQYAKADAAARELPLSIFSAGQLPFMEETPPDSPEAWLGSIANAAVIYSNSFHALVFSHVFHREMCIKPLVRMKNRNSRLFSFIASMNETLLEEETRPGLFRLKESCDWGKVDSQLNKLRNIGFDYLQRITQTHL